MASTLERAPINSIQPMRASARVADLYRWVAKSEMNIHTLILAGLIGCGSWACAAENVGLISELKEGEEMRVDFKSQGCFHLNEFTLHFQRSTNIVVFGTTLEHALIVHLDKTTTSRTNLVTRGPSRLSDCDVAGLDMLWRYYQSHPSGGCTTIDEVTVSRLQADRIVAKEKFKDDTCKTDEMLGVLTLPDLFRRLPQGNDTK